MNTSLSRSVRSNETELNSSRISSIIIHHTQNYTYTIRDEKNKTMWCRYIGYRHSRWCTNLSSAASSICLIVIIQFGYRMCSDFFILFCFHKKNLFIVNYFEWNVCPVNELNRKIGKFISNLFLWIWPFQLIGQLKKKIIGCAQFNWFKKNYFVLRQAFQNSAPVNLYSFIGLWT